MELCLIDFWDILQNNKKITLKNTKKKINKKLLRNGREKKCLTTCDV